MRAASSGDGKKQRTRALGPKEPGLDQAAAQAILRVLGVRASEAAQLSRSAVARWEALA